MPNPEGWLTLADYAQRGATMLLVCRGCYRSREVDGTVAARRWGADTLPAAIEERAKCECGGHARLSWRFPLSGPDTASADPHNFSTPGRRR
jgi:hypothetical protein